MPAHQGPKGHFGHLYFGWVHVIFVSCIRPLFISYLAVQNTPRVHRNFDRWPQRLTHGTGFKHTRLCVRSMWLDWLTSLQHCLFCLISVVTLDALTFFFGPRGARMHTIKRLRILLLWAFDHRFIPKLLLTTRLRLGILQYRHEVKYDVILNYEFLHF